MSSYAFVINGTEHDLLTYYGIRVTGTTGMGMPPADNITTPYAIGDGSYYQRTVYRQRTIQLACAYGTGTQAQYHSNLKKLIADINRDALNSGVFQLKYYGANAGVPALIDVRYAGGLEGNFDYASVFNPFVISLLAVDPFWRSGGANNVSLAISDTSSTHYVLMRTSGVWGALSGTGEPSVTLTQMAFDNSGALWGVAGSNVYRYASGAWTSWAANAAVKCLCCYGSTVYVGGAFTTINSVSANYMARWTGSAWSALPSASGSAPAVTVNAIDTDHDIGVIFVGTNTSPCLMRYLAYLGDSSAYWETLSTSSGPCTALVSRASGFLRSSIWAVETGGVVSVYFNDDFTSGTSTLKFVPDATVRRLVYLPSSGQILIVGDFANIDSTSFPHVAQCHMSSDSTTIGFGSFDNNTIDAVQADDGLEYVVGEFTDASYPYFAKYTSGAWVSGGFTIDATASSIASTTNLLAISYDASIINLPGSTTINNASDHAASPVIVITRTGGTSATVKYFTNTYTGDTLQFSGTGYALQDGETLTITLTPGAQSIISSVNGNVLSRLSPGSSLSTWKVSPGSHVYTQFIDYTGSPTITATLTYYNTYNSADGVAA